MKFLCGGCKTKYQISDAKVRGKILTIRCQGCNARIVVREPSAEEQRLGTYVARLADEATSQLAAASGGSAAPARLRAAFDHVMQSAPQEEEDEAPTRIAAKPDLQLGSSAPDPNALEWFSAAEGQQQGPFTYGELVERITTREVLGAHYVWNHTMVAGWVRVRDSELAHHLPAPTVPVIAGKPLPPAPPPSEANVVDLASKRAERQRPGSDVVETPVTARAGDKWTARTEAEVPRSRPPITKSIPVLEQIAEDDASAIAALEVLKELGLDGPPPTEPPAGEARAPGGVGALAGVATPAELVMPAPKSDGGFDVDLAKDDIFANIPRAAAEPTQLKESTRFFIVAAGVNEKKKRNKIGFIAGGAGAAAFVAFLGAWAFGFVHIPIEGLKSPFELAARPPADDELEEEVEAGGDAKDVRALGGERTRTKRKKRATKATTTQAVAQAGGAQAGGDAKAGATGPRGGDEAQTNYTFDLAGRTQAGLQKEDVKLPDSKPGELALPPVDRAELSERAIAQVVEARRSSVKICYESFLKGSEKLSGRVELKVTIRPSGDVASVQPLNAPARARSFTDCLEDKVKTWKFPTFSGKETADVVVPFFLINGG